MHLPRCHTLISKGAMPWAHLYIYLNCAGSTQPTPAFALAPPPVIIRIFRTTAFRGDPRQSTHVGAVRKVTAYFFFFWSPVLVRMSVQMSVQPMVR